MSANSILMGGFKRTSNFPIESDYIFKLESELKEFYSDEINAATMHKGLLKIVEVDDTNKQSLWWVVANAEGKLEFRKLISFENIDELFNKFSEINEILNKEIENRKTADDAIWGDEDHTLIDQNLNSLKKLSKAVSNLEDNTSNLEEYIKAIVGTEETDIKEYLQTLPYTSLTEIANILKELTDSSTGFIKNLQGEETRTTKIKVINEVDKTTILTQVKISSNSENDIIVKDDGLYHNIDTEYLNGVLTVRVNGNIRLQHNLGLSFIGIHDVRYDSDQETLIIEFKLETGNTEVLNIPVGSIISEWEIDNTHPTKVVELAKERIITGGPDKLSADVRISSNKYNILEKDNNTLIVKGTADNIVFEGDVSVQSKINQIENNIALSDSKYEELKNSFESLDISDMATQSWVEEQNYLTQHQDLDDYYTKGEIDKKIVEYVTEGTVSLDGYATEKWVEDLNYLTEHQSLEDYATSQDLQDLKSDILGDDLTETFDTLKAVQDWANKHGTEYASLTETVSNLEDSVEDVESKLTLLEESIEQESTRAKLQESAIRTRLTADEEEISKSAKVDSENNFANANTFNSTIYFPAPTTVESNILTINKINQGSNIFAYPAIKFDGGHNTKGHEVYKYFGLNPESEEFIIVDKTGRSSEKTILHTDNWNKYITLNNYLPLSGGTLAGDLRLNSSIPTLEFGTYSTGEPNAYIQYDNLSTLTIAGTGSFLEKICFKVGTNGTKLELEDGLFLYGNLGLTILTTTESPINVNSSILCTNLNADLLDGKHASDFALNSDLSKYLPLTGGTICQNEAEALMGGGLTITPTGISHSSVSTYSPSSFHIDSSGLGFTNNDTSFIVSKELIEFKNNLGLINISPSSISISRSTILTKDSIGVSSGEYGAGIHPECISVYSGDYQFKLNPNSITIIDFNDPSNTGDDSDGVTLSFDKFKLLVELLDKITTNEEGNLTFNCEITANNFFKV